MMEREMAPDIPKNLPTKYTKDLKEVELFNASLFGDTEEIQRWHKRYLGEIEPEAMSIFEDYLRRGYLIFGTLVEHPQVPHPEMFRACSVMLQRGVIVEESGGQRLFLRSYMHSAKDSETFVNFVPRGGIEVSFASDSIWFPLELTRVIHEPTSYVVLDILTRKPLESKQLPQPFQIEKKGQVQYEGQTFSATRLNAQLGGKQPAPDLMLKV